METDGIIFTALRRLPHTSRMVRAMFSAVTLLTFSSRERPRSTSTLAESIGSIWISYALLFLAMIPKLSNKTCSMPFSLFGASIDSFERCFKLFDRRIVRTRLLRLSLFVGQTIDSFNRDPRAFENLLGRRIFRRDE